MKTEQEIRDLRNLLKNELSNYDYIERAKARIKIQVLEWVLGL